MTGGRNLSSTKNTLAGYCFQVTVLYATGGQDFESQSGSTHAWQTYANQAYGKVQIQWQGTGREMCFQYAISQLCKVLIFLSAAAFWFWFTNGISAKTRLCSSVHLFIMWCLFYHATRVKWTNKEFVLIYSSLIGKCTRNWGCATHASKLVNRRMQTTKSVGVVKKFNLKISDDF